MAVGLFVVGGAVGQVRIGEGNGGCGTGME